EPGEQHRGARRIRRNRPDSAPVRRRHPRAGEAVDRAAAAPGPRPRITPDRHLISGEADVRPAGKPYLQPHLPEHDGPRYVAATPTRPSGLSSRDVRHLWRDRAKPVRLVGIEAVHNTLATLGLGGDNHRTGRRG